MLYKGSKLFVFSVVFLLVLGIQSTMARPPVEGTYDPVTLRFYESGQLIQNDPDEVVPMKAKSFYKGLKKYAVLFIHGRDQAWTIPVSDWAAQVFTIDTYPSGSIRDYYREVSMMQFDMDGETKGWYTSAYDYSHYTVNYGHNGGAAELVLEAINAAEAEGIDWSQYDNDGDGVVDAVSVIHQGEDAAAGAPNQIWSHLGHLPADQVPTYDGVTFGPYAIDPELSSPTTKATIGTFCHEFGHALGLPDLYDIDYTDKFSPVGAWCTMAHGSDLGSPRGSCPVHFCGYSKYLLGWLHPITPVTSGTYSLTASHISPDNSCLILPINGSDKEFFCIENREPRFGGKFDKLNSRFEGGLLVFHVDQNMGYANTGNTEFWLCVLEDAQPHKDANDKPNKDNADAAFSNDTGKTAFTVDSDPSTLGNYYPSGISLWNVTNRGDTMSFDLFLQPTIVLNDYDLKYTGNHTYELYVGLKNIAGGDAWNVSATIATEAGNVVIDDNLSTFGNISKETGTANNDNNPYVFHSTDDVGSLVTFKVTATADNNYTSQELVLTVPVNPSRILLIDDDQTSKGVAQDYEIAYQEALDLIPMDYETWEVLTLGYPPLSIMQLYDLIIWEDGKATFNAPKGVALDLIADFLDAGGDLFFSSQEFLFSQYGYDPDVPTSDYMEIPDGSFIREYLHIVAMEQDEYFYHCTGVTGGIFSGLTYEFVDTFSGDPTGATQGKYSWWPDEFVVETPTAVEMALPVLTAGLHEFPSGAPAEWADDASAANNTISNASCALTYQGEYRLFFMSAPVACIPTNTASPLNRQEFMTRVFNWFGMSVSTPGIDVDLNQSVYHGGDDLKLTVRVSNPGPAVTADMYLILESYGMYFFYPSWNQTGDAQSMNLGAGEREILSIFDFTWPAGIGAGSQTRFWAAFVKDGALLGNYDYCPISWE